MPRLLLLVPFLLWRPVAEAAVEGGDGDKEEKKDEDSRPVAEFVDETGCIFGYHTWSGKPCKEEEAMKQDREDEYETLMNGHRCKDEKLTGTLDEFCDIKFGEDDVVHCPCCADHLHGEMPRRASLLVSGERTTSVAWIRGDSGDFCRMGHLPIWSLGGDRVPMLWCDSGVLKCECFDPSRDWHEDEPRCATGRRCSAPALIQEKVSERAAEGATKDEEAIEAGDRVRAKVDIFYPPGHVCLKGQPRGLTLQPGSRGTVTSTSSDSDIDLIVEWDQIGATSTACQGAGAVVYHSQVQKFEEDQDSTAKAFKEVLPVCTSMDKVKSSEAAEIAEDTVSTAGGSRKRISIGERRCDSMNAEQCNSFYSTKVIDGGQRLWHFCAVDPHDLRLCVAEVLKADEAKKRADDWERWAVDFTYNPEHTTWSVFLQDGTARVDSLFVPPRDELQDALAKKHLFRWELPGENLEWFRHRWKQHHWKHHRFQRKKEPGFARGKASCSWLLLFLVSTVMLLTC